MAAAADVPAPANAAPAAQPTPLNPLKLHRCISAATNCAGRLARQATARLHREGSARLVFVSLVQG